MDIKDFAVRMASEVVSPTPEQTDTNVTIGDQLEYLTAVPSRLMVLGAIVVTAYASLRFVRDVKARALDDKNTNHVKPDDLLR